VFAPIYACLDARQGVASKAKEADMALEVGSTVKLKSGGPVMTVAEEVTDKNLVRVIWFQSNDQSSVKETYLPVAVLKEVTLG
jgi:uncharacterized protein YodC (DUF2158 family)